MGKVNSALAALPWVEESSVDFKNKMCTVVVKTDSYDEAATVDAIRALNFGVTVL
ncbi:MAG: hypothetical protein O3A95_08090 [Planctomycetota bacterium]|nr:hypothetical protein [Planctomycetota bacterium]MDA1114242.1 hypothetical protein [Planctomycetota bacterium]